MSPETHKHELCSFKTEYAPFLDSIAFPAEADATTQLDDEALPPQDPQPDSVISFVTRESDRYICDVTDAGWYIQQTEKYYATSQEMLSDVSPKFTKEWGDRLLHQLEALAETS